MVGAFRVDSYFYIQSVISFLSRSRNIDDRDFRLLDMSVGSGANYWEIIHKDAPTSGMRLRSSMAICYGDIPAGFTANGVAQPLPAGRHSVQMDARDGADDIRLYSHFCLSGEGRLIDCDAQGRRPSFLRQLHDWVFGA